MKEGAFYPWLVQQKPLALPPGSLLFAGAGDFDEIGREFLGHFVNLTRLQRGETILDVGCGVGRMAKALTQYVSPKAQYWGVDVGRSAVDWCQSHLTPAFPNFHFQHIDVQSRVYNPEGRIPADRFRLPYGDATFDFAFLTSVFTHLLPADAAQYLREVGRVLKPDGRCLATFFLVNETTRSALDREGGSIRFPNALDGCWVSSTEAPEAAVALPETAVRGWSMEAGMAVVEPIRYGSWSGAILSPLSYQDIVVLAKPEWNRPRGGTVDSSQFSTPHPLPSRVTRSMEVDVDRLGNEVILMHLSNLELRLLNEVGTILWEALEVIPEPSELVEMLVESHPNQSRETHAANVAVFIDELARAGFLTVEASGGLDVP